MEPIKHGTIVGKYRVRSSRNLEAELLEFMVLMKGKLQTKRDRGWKGWGRLTWEQCIDRANKCMREAIESGNEQKFADAANFMLFAWSNGITYKGYTMET